MFETKGTPLKFVPLDLDTARLLLIPDATFANNYDLRSHFGYVMTLVDIKSNENILHHGSNR